VHSSFHHMIEGEASTSSARLRPDEIRTLTHVKQPFWQREVGMTNEGSTQANRLQLILSSCFRQWRATEDSVPTPRL